MARQQVLQLAGGAVRVDFDLTGRFATAIYGWNTEAVDHHLTFHFLPPDQQPQGVTQPTQTLDLLIPQGAVNQQLPFDPAYSINIDWGGPQCTVEWVNLN